MSTPKRRFNLLSLTFIVLCFKKSLLIGILSRFFLVKSNVKIKNIILVIFLVVNGCARMCDLCLRAGPGCSNSD